LVSRRFEYLFPVNEDGEEIGFDDFEVWQTELGKAVGEIQVHGAGFTIDLENCGLTDREVNGKVIEITRKHLLTDCGGVFWGTVSNDNWKTYEP